MWKEFKAFIMRGNVIDLAIGIVIGVAFGKVVSSFVSDILMPPIGLAIGKVDFSNLFVVLSGQHYNSLAEAKAAGAPTINYGLFINSLIDFLIIALALFVIVRVISAFRSKPAPAPEMKPCPFCAEPIHVEAHRCPHCTSALELQPA
jgi:large conductance mechanosensitive channel